jgi:drug/metabolite transporter (DMT)-like permease
MLGATTSIALVDAAAKYLARDLNGVQVAWGYFVAMLVCLSVLLAFSGAFTAALLRCRHPWLQLARASSLMLSLGCLFFSLRYLPLAEATTIAFTAPLFIVALSAPLLGERVGPDRWVAVILGLIGALVVARPGAGLLHPAALVALLGAFFFATFNIVTRKLGNGDAMQTTLFYTFALGAAGMSLTLPWIWVTPTPTHWGVLGICGLLGVFAHFAIVRALSLADASTVAPLNYTRLVWAIAIGVVVFDDVPDAMSLLGGAITMASGLYVLYSASRPSN